MSETWNEQLERLRLMADPDSGTWNLSDNDRDAISALRQRVEELEQQQGATAYSEMTRLSDGWKKAEAERDDWKQAALNARQDAMTSTAVLDAALERERGLREALTLVADIEHLSVFDSICRCSNHNSKDCCNNAGMCCHHCMAEAALLAYPALNSDGRIRK